MSSDIPPAEYISATITKAEDLGGRTSFLTLDFQCHPSNGRRFTNLRIELKFKTMYSAGPTSPLRVEYAAPRHSIGGGTDEERRKILGLSVPSKLGNIAASVEVAAKAEFEVHKTVPHAMTITGTTRGKPANYCVWTVQENKSSATGIPTHFRIGAVLTHDGPLETNLDVKGKIEGRLWWPRMFHCHSKGLVNISTSEAKPKGDPGWWKLVQLINGELPGADTVFTPPMVSRMDLEIVNCYYLDFISQFVTKKKKIEVFVALFELWEYEIMIALPKLSVFNNRLTCMKGRPDGKVKQTS
jgi:hypothetical protein